MKLWRAQRVDVLDLIVVVCGLVAAIVLVPWAVLGNEDPALVVAAPALLSLVAVVWFSGWWDLERADYEALPTAAGRWRIVRRWLPAGCMVTGFLMLGVNLVRIAIGNQDWFSRYVMGVYWAIAGCITIGHGVMRIRAEKTSSVASAT